MRVLTQTEHVSIWEPARLCQLSTSELQKVRRAKGGGKPLTPSPVEHGETEAQRRAEGSPRWWRNITLESEFSPPCLDPEAWGQVSSRSCRCLHQGCSEQRLPSPRPPPTATIPLAEGLFVEEENKKKKKKAGDMRGFRLDF